MYKNAEDFENKAESYGADLCCICRECDHGKNNPCQHKVDAMCGYTDGYALALQKLATVICNEIGIGVSAESILAFCTGVENKSMYPPADADDFKRCHNLLSAFPEWKNKLKDIGKTHKAWGTVGEHWSEIEKAYLKENYKAVHNMLDKYRQEEAK